MLKKYDYGINKEFREFTINKLKYQQKYLYENYVDMGNNILIPYADFFKNSWHNSHRYIAEINHRVFSLNEYAKEKDLYPIFAVVTLPTEYHRLKSIKLKNGKTKLVNNKKYIDNEEHSVRAGNRKLQEVIRNIFNQRIFRSIDKSDKCYITTREPHKDGTPHLNLLIFVPKDKIENCVEVIKECFIDKHSRVEVAIKNPTAYIMKYIFKTLDDLRNNNNNLENLSNLTLWYITHKIPRMTMSKTFISLDIYRALGGRYDIKTLTYMYKNKMLQVLLDHNNKVVTIYDDVAQIYNKKRHFNVKPYLVKDKPIIRKEYEYFDNTKKPIRFVNHMRDLELYDYFKSLEIDTTNLNHYALTNNELAKRGFQGFNRVSLNYFNNDFEVEEYENPF